MKRTSLGTGRDPLLLFLLAAIGAAEVGGCGGLTDAQRGTSLDSPNPSGGSGGDSGNPIMGSAAGRLGTAAGGMAALADPPPGEGVIGCAMPTPYPAPFPLPDPVPDTGFFSCTNSPFIHRAVAKACPPPYEDAPPAPDGCAHENYCSDLPHGRCLSGNGCPVEECLSECQSDADCQPNELCLCDSQINHCVAANCHTDDECGPGLLCISTWLPIDGMTPFTCQNAGDECTATCANYKAQTANGTTAYMYETCTLTTRDDGSAQRDCSYSSSTGGTCGRPFLVQGAALTAEAVRRRDWALTMDPAPAVDAIALELRRALAHSWRDAALMEHASIAAFARFSLELLALAAPPELVRDAAQALADEQRHAELCFGLASTYAGVPLGPGALDVRSCLQDVSLANVLVTTFLEGCIGETIAAVEARKRAQGVNDRALAAALYRIAEDEAHHAALAWRFVKWALGERAAGLEDVLFAALETERARLVVGEPLPRGVSDELARAHGLLSTAERARLRREALDEIVAPCLAALCAPRASGVFHVAPADDETTAAPPPAAVA